MNWYTPLMIMSGCRFLALDRKSVNESWAWPTVVVALAPTAGARLIGCLAVGTNHDDGARPISYKQR